MIGTVVLATVLGVVVVGIMFTSFVDADDESMRGIAGMIIMAIFVLVTRAAYDTWTEQQERRDCAAVLGAVAKEKP